MGSKKKGKTKNKANSVDNKKQAVEEKKLEKVDQEESEAVEEQTENDIPDEASSEDKKIVLPQNVLLVGDKDNKNTVVYIHQKVYKDIHRFTKDKLVNESGGFLIGDYCEEFGKLYVIIEAFIEAKHTEQTPNSITFTHDTWTDLHKHMDKKYEDKKIVGWIHTHPSFGIFLSDYDKFIQDNFFNEKHQVAYVVDPINKDEGFFVWENGSIEKCKGFYIYDKVGADISGSEFKDNSSEKAATEVANFGGYKQIIIYAMMGIMAICIICLLFVVKNFSNRLSRLETQQDNLVASANESLTTLSQNIYLLDCRVTGLENVLINQQDEVTTTTDAVEAATSTDADDELDVATPTNY